MFIVRIRSKKSKRLEKVEVWPEKSCKFGAKEGMVSEEISTFKKKPDNVQERCL
jgi:hypothetical protein